MSAVLAVTENSLSLDEVTVKYGISRGCLRSWLWQIRTSRRRGTVGHQTERETPENAEAEADKLERLGKENEYLKAENVYLKKIEGPEPGKKIPGRPVQGRYRPRTERRARAQAPPESQRAFPLHITTTSNRDRNVTPTSANA